MAKRKNTWTEAKIKKYFKEGRGHGDLSNYKPWLNNQDVPSSGRSHRIKGWTTKRVHHLFSDQERNYFYILDWADEVLDIKEQFPLNREVTHHLSNELNINHPIDPATQVPIVMTTDFLITLRKDKNIFDIARTIKPSQELEKPRVIEKFEIERKYWEKQKIDWGIVTEKEMPMQLVNNISWVHSSRNLDEDMQEGLLDTFYRYMREHQTSLADLFLKFDKSYNLEAGTALAIFKHVIANKTIQINMSNKLDFTVAHTNELTIPDINKPNKRWAT